MRLIDPADLEEQAEEDGDQFQYYKYAAARGDLYAQVGLVSLYIFSVWPTMLDIALKSRLL